VERFKDKVAAAVAEALQAPKDAVLASLEAPKDRSRGDLALPCFKLAKPLGKEGKSAAVEIAKDVVAKTKKGGLIQDVQAAGPFVNFKLSPAGMAQDVLAECFASEKFGGSDVGRGKTIVIDYSSPNVAKPFHLGHLRSTVIGHSERKLYELLGYQVVGVNHLGDWGTQFGFMLAAWQRWGAEAQTRIEKGEDEIDVFVSLYVRVNQLAKEDEKVRDEARAWFKKLEDGDRAALDLWRYFVDKSKAEFQRIYDMLGIHHESDAGESFYNDKMKEVVDLARAKGVLVRGQKQEKAEEDDLADARAADARPEGVDLGDPEKGGLGFAILLKSDGGTTYLTRDLAAVFFRERTYRPEKIVYVVGAPQILHFRQLKAILAKLAPELEPKVVHVPFGQYLGMSTRKGTAVFLKEVLERAKVAAQQAADEAKMKADLTPAEIEANARIIGVGAVRFFDLRSHRVNDIDLATPEGGVDLERLLAPKGDTGPYVQWTYARLSGVLRKLGREPTPSVDFAKLSEPEASALVKAIAELAGTVKVAAEQLQPSIVARYLLDLASAANQFLHVHRVIDAEPAVRDARALLVACARKAVGQCLDLLGIEPLEKM
jgi:arginyl-tRNA synthetase